MNTADHNKRVVKDFLATFSEGDIEGVVAGLADNATWWVLGSMDGFSGTYSAEEMGKLLPSFKSIYKAGALRLTPLIMTAEENRVAVEAEGDVVDLRRAEDDAEGTDKRLASQDRVVRTVRQDLVVQGGIGNGDDGAVLAIDDGDVEDGRGVVDDGGEQGVQAGIT